MTALRAEVAKWIAATWRPVAAFVTAMLVLAVVADRHNRWLVAFVALALVAAASWLNYAIGQARRDASYDVSRARLVVSSAQLVIANVAVGASRAGWLPEAIGFTGVRPPLL